jgi:hypothetical protein
LWLPAAAAAVRHGLVLEKLRKPAAAAAAVGFYKGSFLSCQLPFTP